MSDSAGQGPRFKSFKEFYPFYLREHSHPTCRRLHFVGTTGVNVLIFAAVFTQKPVLLAWIPLAGYGFAWMGHFVFEKNRPATFKNPFYSLMGDYLMYWQLLTRRISFNPAKTIA